MPAGIPPIRRYAVGDRLYVQAQRIWLILASFVSGMTRGSTDRTTLSYGELALCMGYGDARAGHMLGRQLGIVGNYCVLNGLPPLNVIVVNQDTGVPGDEVVLRPGRTVRQEQRAVFSQDWFEVGVPSTGTLRKIWEQM
jgi:hypothetical protein